MAAVTKVAGMLSILFDGSLFRLHHMSVDTGSEQPWPDLSFDAKLPQNPAEDENDAPDIFRLRQLKGLNANRGPTDDNVRPEWSRTRSLHFSNSEASVVMFRYSLRAAPGGTLPKFKFHKVNGSAGIVSRAPKADLDSRNLKVIIFLGISPCLCRTINV